MRDYYLDARITSLKELCTFMNEKGYKINYTLLSKYSSGERPPKMAFIYYLAFYLGLSPEDALVLFNSFWLDEVRNLNYEYMLFLEELYSERDKKQQ